MIPYEAMSEITTMFRAAYSGPCELPNKPLDRASLDRFATLTFEHGDMGQASLANVDNRRKYTNTGVCLIELFFPVGIGVDEPYQLAETICAVYRGKRSPSDVWFRDVRIIERNAKMGNPPRFAGL